MPAAEMPVRNALKYNLPSLVEERLAEALRTAVEEGELNAKRVEQLRGKIDQGEVPCYEHDWAAFAYLYFALNAAKVAYASQKLTLPRDKREIRILDLGCGSGASTVGLIQSLLDKHEFARFHVWAVDTNRKQLELYDRVVNPWLRSINRSSSRLVMRDALEVVREEEEWDIVVASYLLCELTPEKRSELEQYVGKWADRTDAPWILVYQLPGMRKSKYKVSNLPPEGFPEVREGFDKPLVQLP